MKKQATLFPEMEIGLANAVSPTWGQQVAALIMHAKVEHNKRGVPFTARDVAAVIDAADSARPVRGPRAKLVNGRNLLFDALACGCGLVEPYTASAAGQVAKALKEIQAIQPNVTAEELTATAKAVRRKFEDAGPIAVATHWHSFAASRRVKRTEPKAPPGWLARLNERFPGSTKARGGAFEITKETDYEFSQLDESVRRELQNVGMPGDAAKCPGCDTAVTIENAGGYRTFCDKCTDAMPQIPGPGGWQIEGRFPAFRWIKQRC